MSTLGLRWSWGPIAGVLLLAGCGSKAAPPAGGETSSSTGSDSDGACADLFDTDEAHVEAVVSIRNATDAAILLPIACGLDYIRIDAGSLLWPGPWCEGTCEEQECGSCGGCLPGSYLRIDPGQAHTLSWSGDLFEIVTPPQECKPQFGCYETCGVLRPVPDTLTATAQAISLAACEVAAGDPSGCACAQPDADPCEIVGPELTPDVSASAPFARGDNVTVVFE